MQDTARKFQVHRISWVVENGDIRLGVGDSSFYKGDADFVFCHPYAPLPHCLIEKPAVVNLFGDKRALGVKWCRGELNTIGCWGTGHTNTIYSVRCALPEISVDDLVETPPGWFPLELCLRVLKVVNLPPGSVVWDGFMGRGTVGKACQELGLRFVGIDARAERVQLARQYLGC